MKNMVGGKTGDSALIQLEGATLCSTRKRTACGADAFRREQNKQNKPNRQKRYSK
jgi:hypothetical protein